MKITCQACQSKYTIADDKIQGKVAKIRCRKCGATVLVDASGGGPQTNGSVTPATGSAGAEDAWLVSVAEGEQRTMKLEEVIDAYNTGVVTGETYIWKDGMADWVPLAEAPEIVAALNDASGAAAPAQPEPASAPAAPLRAPVAFSPPVAAAARREPTRGRSGDLFGAGAAEEEVATSAPAQAARAQPAAVATSGHLGAASTAVSATGARDEHSVLFSLNALTSNAKPAAATSSSPSSRPTTTEDSGLIDLNALAKAQAARPAEAAPLAPPATPFLFPAALGTVETEEPTQAKKSSMPLLIGGGVAVAGLAIALALVATRKSDEPAPAPATSLSAAPTPEVPTKRAGAATGARPSAPKGGGQPAAAPPPPPAPVKRASPCGCAAGDLQCQIRCSATGH
jgi:predicted Zn finger-like uncharacterized protein